MLCHITAILPKLRATALQISYALHNATTGPRRALLIHSSRRHQSDLAFLSERPLVNRRRSNRKTMGLLPLLRNDFKYSLTLFSKSFASFVHTTCSLSVSEQYLAFVEVHQRIWTAFPNCPTLRIQQRYCNLVAEHNRTVTFDGLPFQENLPCSRLLAAEPLHYNSKVLRSRHPGFKHRLFPVHSPLLRES